jgi:hypothetical protein
VQRCDRNYWYFTPDNLQKLRNIMCTWDSRLLRNSLHRLQLCLVKRKKERKSDIDAIRISIGLDSLVQKRPNLQSSCPIKIELFSQEMHLKILLSSRGLKLTNFKAGCRVSALLFFLWNRYPPWLSDAKLIQKSVFKLLIPELTPVSLVES